MANESSEVFGDPLDSDHVKLGDSGYEVIDRGPNGGGSGGGGGIEDAPDAKNYARTKGKWVDITTIVKTPVNADWNATSGLAQILNKPTLPAAQIQSDWSQADDTKLDFIKNKPTIPPAYTLPSATADALGGVKLAAAVADLAEGADAAAIVTTVNDLLAKLRAAGIVAA